MCLKFWWALQPPADHDKNDSDSADRWSSRIHGSFVVVVVVVVFMLYFYAIDLSHGLKMESIKGF